MRPRFEVADAPDADVLWRALRAGLQQSDAPCVGQLFRRHAVLQVSADQQHFWSPQLALELRDEDTLTLVGRFSPHPHVWTFFMAIYGLLAMGGLAGAIYGLSQTLLHEPAWALFAVPAAVLMAGFVFGATFIGQGLGGEQMYVLRSFVDQAVDEARSQP